MRYFAAIPIQHATTIVNGLVDRIKRELDFQRKEGKKFSQWELNDLNFAGSKPLIVPLTDDGHSDRKMYLWGNARHALNPGRDVPFYQGNIRDISRLIDVSTLKLA